MKNDARVYLRVSRPSEADILTNQRVEAAAYAADRNIRVVRWYEEVASGGDENRSELSRLMHDVRWGEFVIFTSLSRMTRGGVGAALDILRKLERLGAGWHFVQQPILNFDSHTPKLVSDILLAVFAAIDEDYRRRISDATKAAYARRKALAESRGDRLTWGRPRKALPRDDGGKTP